MNPVEEARAMSRAVLICISGIRKEYLQAIVRSQFVAYCEQHEFKNWADAWHDFWPKFKETNLYKAVIEVEHGNSINPLPGNLQGIPETGTRLDQAPDKRRSNRFHLNRDGSQ